MIRFSAKSSLIAVLLGAVALSAGLNSSSSWAQRSELDAEHPELMQDALAVLRNQGLDSYLRYFREQPQVALDFRAWCREQKAANGGNVIFEFTTHAEGVEIIDALNATNKAMGFDCYEVKAKIDNESVRDPRTPSLDQAKTYARVSSIRNVAQPLIGLALITGPLTMALVHNPAFSTLLAHGSEVSMATMKGALEAQFAIYTAWWNANAFGLKTFPKLEIQKKLDTQASSYFKRSAATLAKPYNLLVAGINHALSKTGGRLRAGDVNISAINLAVYPFLMGAATHFGAHLPFTDNSLGFLSNTAGAIMGGFSMVWAQKYMSLSFNTTIMPYQSNSGAALKQGLWGEAVRMYIEGIAVVVFNSFRGTSAIYPQLETPMIISQLAVGGLLSAMMIAKVHGVIAYARQSGKILDDMEISFSPEERAAVAEANNLTTIAADLDAHPERAAELAAKTEAFQSQSLVKKLALATLGKASASCDAVMNAGDKASAWVFDKWKWGFKNDALKILTPKK